MRAFFVFFRAFVFLRFNAKSNNGFQRELKNCWCEERQNCLKIEEEKRNVCNVYRLYKRKPWAFDATTYWYFCLFADDSDIPASVLFLFSFSFSSFSFFFGRIFLTTVFCLISENAYSYEVECSEKRGRGRGWMKTRLFINGRNALYGIKWVDNSVWNFTLTALVWKVLPRI